MVNKENEKLEYELGMAKAAKDPAFVNRTMECQRQFDAIDMPVKGNWD